MSFGSVISRFGAFVRNIQSPPDTAGPEVPFPVQLEPVRATVEHHLVPLIIVGRSDHELLESERDVIVDHCRARLRRRDKLLSATEISTLEDYIEHFAPNASQLDAALRKLEAGGQDELTELLQAADRVILADDKVRAEEQSQLSEIKAQLDQLRTKS